MTSRRRRNGGRPFRVGRGVWLVSWRGGRRGFDGLRGLRTLSTTKTSRGIALGRDAWLCLFSFPLAITFFFFFFFFLNLNDISPGSSHPFNPVWCEVTYWWLTDNCSPHLTTLCVWAFVCVGLGGFRRGPWSLVRLLCLPCGSLLGRGGGGGGGSALSDLP